MKGKQVMKNRNILYTMLLLALGFLVLSPTAQAVSPAPDGGYPGGNTAEGQNALLSLTSGNYNTGVGIYSLLSLTDGNFNTGVGAGTLLVNTADQNTATGAGALFSNTTGSNNTANGTFALFSNTEGAENTASGFQALFSNTMADGNTAIGYQALFSNTGSPATSSLNTAIGFQALLNNTGSLNTALGVGAGAALTTGSNNIYIGNEGGSAESNTIRIGQDHTDTFIAGISGATVAGGIPVIIDANGHLGTVPSSQRFKAEIKSMDKVSEAVLALKPVTFHYKSDATGTPQFGLIAEEVAAVNPDLVVRDEKGEIYTVRYDAVNAMLLNEFLKEHHKVQELEATVAQERRDFETTITGLKKEMESIIARSNEQDAKIQKVSTQVELNQAALRTVADY
jgi:hypothetical protein